LRPERNIFKFSITGLPKIKSTQSLARYFSSPWDSSNEAIRDYFGAFSSNDENRAMLGKIICYTRVMAEHNALKDILKRGSFSNVYYLLYFLKRMDRPVEIYMKIVNAEKRFSLEQRGALRCLCGDMISQQASSPVVKDVRKNTDEAYPMRTAVAGDMGSNVFSLDRFTKVWMGYCRTQGIESRGNVGPRGDIFSQIQNSFKSVAFIKKLLKQQIDERNEINNKKLVYYVNAGKCSDISFLVNSVASYIRDKGYEGFSIYIIVTNIDTYSIQIAGKTLVSLRAQWESIVDLNYKIVALDNIFKKHVYKFSDIINDNVGYIDGMISCLGGSIKGRLSAPTLFKIVEVLRLRGWLILDYGPSFFEGFFEESILGATKGFLNIFSGFKGFQDRAGMNSKVLFMVENEWDLEIFKTVLTRKGYRVTGACNSREALRVLEKDSADMIIINADIMFLDDLDLICEIKQLRQRGKNIPPVIIRCAQEKKHLIDRDIVNFPGIKIVPLNCKPDDFFEVIEQKVFDTRLPVVDDCQLPGKAGSSPIESGLNYVLAYCSRNPEGMLAGLKKEDNLAFNQNIDILGKITDTGDLVRAESPEEMKPMVKEFIKVFFAVFMIGIEIDVRRIMWAELGINGNRIVNDFLSSNFFRGFIINLPGKEYGNQALLKIANYRNEFCSYRMDDIFSNVSDIVIAGWEEKYSSASPIDIKSRLAPNVSAATLLLNKEASSSPCVKKVFKMAPSVTIDGTLIGVMKDCKGETFLVRESPFLHRIHHKVLKMELDVFDTLGKYKRRRARKITKSHTLRVYPPGTAPRLLRGRRRRFSQSKEKLIGTNLFVIYQNYFRMARISIPQKVYHNRGIGSCLMYCALKKALGHSVEEFRIYSPIKPLRESLFYYFSFTKDGIDGFRYYFFNDSLSIETLEATFRERKDKQGFEFIYLDSSDPSSPVGNSTAILVKGKKYAADALGPFKKVVNYMGLRLSEQVELLEDLMYPDVDKFTLSLSEKKIREPVGIRLVIFQGELITTLFVFKSDLSNLYPLALIHMEVDEVDQLYRVKVLAKYNFKLEPQALLQRAIAILVLKGKFSKLEILEPYRESESMLERMQQKDPRLIVVFDAERRVYAVQAKNPQSSSPAKKVESHRNSKDNVLFLANNLTQKEMAAAYEARRMIEEIAQRASREYEKGVFITPNVIWDEYIIGKGTQYPDSVGQHQMWRIYVRVVPEYRPEAGRLITQALEAEDVSFKYPLKGGEVIVVYSLDREHSQQLMASIFTSFERNSFEARAAYEGINPLLRASGQFYSSKTISFRKGFMGLRILENAIKRLLEERDNVHGKQGRSPDQASSSPVGEEIEQRISRAIKYKSIIIEERTNSIHYLQEAGLAVDIAGRKNSSPIQESNKHILSFDNTYVGTIPAFGKIKFILGRKYSPKDYILISDGQGNIINIYPKNYSWRPVRFYLVKDYKTNKLIAVLVGRYVNQIDPGHLAGLSRRRQVIIEDVYICQRRGKEESYGYIIMSGRSYPIADKDNARQRRDILVEAGIPIWVIGEETRPKVLRNLDGTVHFATKGTLLREYLQSAGIIEIIQTDDRGRASLIRKSFAALADGRTLVSVVYEKNYEGIPVVVRSDEWGDKFEHDNYDVEYIHGHFTRLTLKPNKKSTPHIFKVILDEGCAPIRSYKGNISKKAFDGFSGVINGLKVRKLGKVMLAGLGLFVPRNYKGMDAIAERSQKNKEIILRVISRDAVMGYKVFDLEGNDKGDFIYTEEAAETEYNRVLTIISSAKTAKELNAIRVGPQLTDTIKLEIIKKQKKAKKEKIKEPPTPSAIIEDGGPKSERSQEEMAVAIREARERIQRNYLKIEQRAEYLLLIENLTPEKARQILKSDFPAVPKGFIKRTIQSILDTSVDYNEEESTDLNFDECDEEKRGGWDPEEDKIIGDIMRGPRKGPYSSSSPAKKVESHRNSKDNVLFLANNLTKEEMAAAYDARRMIEKI
ncbi:MAG: response regulator transcription factor, partial [Candidatus Omnitrophica bacterium]|nr:response regulator transcription factor [Candidatus Omnitrophota bacterium]